MSDHTSIEWADATWNPVVGCSIVSSGCTHCYAMRQAARLLDKPGSHYAGTTRAVNGNAVWTGKVALAPDHILTQPMRWKRPRRIFVNSMGDLFHEGVPDAWIDRAFAVMALCPQHTFLVLTKRSARMREYFTANTGQFDVGHACGRIADAIQPMRTDNRAVGPVPHLDGGNRWWPLANVWLGVSAEDQQRADDRIPDLLATPAAKRFVSCEPLLGPVSLERVGNLNVLAGALPDVVARARRDAEPRALSGLQIDSLGGAGQATIFHQTPDHMGGFSIRFPRPFPRLDWVITGGESGPGARPMHPDWVRALRDQCVAAGVPFFFKQWGEWAPALHDDEDDGRVLRQIERVEKFDPWNARVFDPHKTSGVNWRLLGKTRAGRLLDGREWNEVPG